MDNQQLDDIIQRLERMELLLKQHIFGRNPRAKTDADAPTTASAAELHQRRVAEIERIFFKIVNSPAPVRRDSYHQPATLLEHAKQPYRQAVTASVLVNQAALRKLFKRQCQSDFNFNTPADIARHVLADSNLIQRRMRELNVDSFSDTLVVLSPSEAQHLLKDPSTLPRKFKGWSCTERAEDKPSPAGGTIAALPEICVQRVWSLGGADEAVVPREGLKRLRRDLLVGGTGEDAVPPVSAPMSWKEVEDAPDPSEPAPPKRRVMMDEQEDEAPAGNLAELLDGGEDDEDGGLGWEEPAPEPTSGFRTRVKFVDDEDA